MHPSFLNSRRGSGALCRSSLVGAALFALSACGGSKPPPPAAPTVAVAKVRRETLSNTMTLQAEFEPFQDVMIHAKVSGFVNPIRVDIGDRVKAGELLATLEVPELKDQLGAARATQQRSKSEHDIARLNNDRLLQVSKTQPNLVAQQDLDDASAKEAAAEAAYLNSKAEADRYSTLLDYTHVTAPFAGIITKRFVDNGALVEAGTSSNTGPIVELAQNDLLRLRFPVPEAETPLIQTGGTVQVEVEALHQSFRGKIARDGWGIDRSTRTMIAEIDVPNPDGVYKAGMYASVILPLQQAGQVLTVPLQALSSGDHPTVLVVNASAAIEQRRVTVGMRTSSLAEIRSGVAEGEQVVVGERAGLSPGTVVAPKLIETPAVN